MLSCEASCNGGVDNWWTAGWTVDSFIIALSLYLYKIGCGAFTFWHFDSHYIHLRTILSNPQSHLMLAGMNLGLDLKRKTAASVRLLQTLVHKDSPCQGNFACCRSPSQHCLFVHVKREHSRLQCSRASVHVPVLASPSSPSWVLPWPG